MLRLTSLFLVASTFCLAGCGDFNPFGRPKTAALPDPQAPIRLIARFYGENAPQSTNVEVLPQVGSRKALTLPIETQIQMAAALQTDSRPLRSGQDVDNIRGTTATPLATVILNGPNGALVLYLDTYGLSMGYQGNHRLINAQLSHLLRRQFNGAGMMTGRLGQIIDLSLKKAAGQVNLYQQIPPDLSAGI